MNAHSQIKPEAPFKVRANLAKPIHCFAVRLEALLRVRPFISVEETRYYLNGVYVHAHQDGGAVCVATDGHRMGVRRDASGLVHEPQIVKVPREIKAPGKAVRNPWAILTRSGERFGHLSLVEGIHDSDHDTPENAIARVEDCFQRYGDVLIDGTFPDYARVLPVEADNDKSIGFNGKYLASFGTHLTLRGGEAMAPHIVLDNDDREFIGVVMPMRSGVDRRQDWTRALAATPPEA